MTDDLEEIPTMEPRSYSGGFGIPMPDPDEMCEICKERVGRAQSCPSCGRRHGHGMIHVHKHGLAWACRECVKARRSEIA